jgi:GNAT superfamily N-acetyltransferase
MAESHRTSAYANERTQLPHGYRYAAPGGVTDNELVYLFGQLVKDDAFGHDQLYEHGYDLRNYYDTIVGVGVRNAGHRLIGYGCLGYTGLLGELVDLVVDEDYRGDGVGRIIILERLRLADSAGVTVLYIEDMLQSNTLRSFYLEHGFKEIGGILVRGDTATLLPSSHGRSLADNSASGTPLKRDC